MSISVIVISKNAEGLIADCLQSVLDLADEIIVVDCGSEDRTLDIAQKMGAKVFRRLSNDFSDMRNFGLKKARGDWVLYIDTDERTTDSLRKNIKYQISRLAESKQANIKYTEFVAYKIKRKNFYLGNNEWPYIEKLERLFRRDKLKGWRGKLHESPIVDGKIGELDGFLLHYTHRSLSSMLEKTIEWSKTEAELRFNASHPKMTWWRFFRVMLSAFFNSLILQQGWKVGAVGLIESFYQAFSTFVTYARLWELQKKNEKTQV